jgi:hypothetical protein
MKISIVDHGADSARSSHLHVAYPTREDWAGIGGAACWATGLGRIM